MACIRAQLCRLQKGRTRLAGASDKVYQSLAHGRWYFPVTTASSITKTGLHDIAEILLKVALKHQKSKSNHTGAIIVVQSVPTTTKVGSSNLAETRCTRYNVA